MVVGVDAATDAAERRPCTSTRRDGRAAPISARDGAHRSHRSMGGGDFRGLALADDYSSEGRHRQHSAESSGAARGRGLGSGQDDATGEQCKAYGRQAGCRAPSMRISWLDTTRAVRQTTDADAHSASEAAAQPARSWQCDRRGDRAAMAAAASRSSAPKTVTTNLRPGTCERTACPTATNGVHQSSTYVLPNGDRCRSTRTWWTAVYCRCYSRPPSTTSWNAMPVSDPTPCGEVLM